MYVILLIKCCIKINDNPPVDSRGVEQLTQIKPIVYNHSKYKQYIYIVYIYIY